MITTRLLWLTKLLFSAGVITLMATGCKDDKNNFPRNTYAVSGNASGAQEVPAVSTRGDAVLSGNYNSTTNILQYFITWANLNDSLTNGGMHFHGPALPGTNAPVLKPIRFTNRAKAGFVVGADTLTDAQEADMLAGKWYFNLHTKPSPGGEVRGQVITTLQ
jgi:hypothetical protein